MPHLVLEYSSNIIDKNQINTFFKNAHEILVKDLPTKLESCKSRAYESDKYYVGNGSHDNAFIHLSLKILPGRSKAIKDLVAKSLFDLITNTFSQTIKELYLHISVEVDDLSNVYFKG